LDVRKTQSLHRLQAVQASNHSEAILALDDNDRVEDAYRPNALHQLRNFSLIDRSPLAVDDYLANWHRYCFVVLRHSHAVLFWKRGNVGSSSAASALLAG
jgi:hypothetical protein